MNTVSLHDGVRIPQLGYGLWQVEDDKTEEVVLEALKVGYRSIDSAQVYQNEAGLGRALKHSGLKRSDYFITTKIWNSEQAYDAALRSFDVSMKKLGLDELDLLLIHWPSPHRNLYVETWKALIQLKKDKRVRSIGVSNFNVDHLERIIQETSVVPSVNQIELHPKFQQSKLREFHRKHQIATESWSPLGQGHVIQDEGIAKIAKKHGKTPAQVIIRWHLQNDLIVIPKSVTPSRIRENFEVFNFTLDSEDLETIRKMDDPKGKIGPEPATAQF